MEKHLEVKQARNGKGVFAKKNFKNDSTLFEVKGTFLTCFEDEIIDDHIRDNTFRFDKDLFLSPEGEIANYANHSCVPNAKVVKKNKKLYLVAIADIQKGEEVVFDYSTIIAADDVWSMNCNCGTDNCRSVVKRFTLLPKTLKDIYMAKNIVPSYILDIQS